MTVSKRLGGFKILRDMARFSLVLPGEGKNLPADLFRAIALKKINLPYLTLIRSGRFWSLNLTVDSVHGLKTSLLIRENLGDSFNRSSEIAILSIFPHNRDPDILGRLFETFSLRGVKPEALANSPSAISILLREELLSSAARALFEPFNFSAYRTPEDWKLAQEGKEDLYKEVVASYQEKRPKVYGLEYNDGQELLRVRMTGAGMTHLAEVFKEFARSGLDLTFIATGPSDNEKEEILAFCLPHTKGRSNQEFMKEIAPNMDMDIVAPVVIFSMNGPHFGDRFGIVSELLNAFEKNGVDLLCLGCTIASITCVVQALYLDPAIRVIKKCFEVPAVVKK